MLPQAILPYDIHAVPVKMDGQGIRTDDLRAILSGWDKASRGMPRYAGFLVFHWDRDH